MAKTDPVRGRFAADRRQRLPEHGDPLQQPAVPGQPEGGRHPRQQHDPSRRQLRHPGLHGADEEVLGDEQARRDARRRLPDSPRSHFRAMDIWHTCEPEKVGTEGWLGRAPASSTPTRKTSSRPSALGRACRAAGRCPACRWPASPAIWNVRLPAAASRATQRAACARALRQDVQPRDRQRPGHGLPGRDRRSTC